MSEGFWLGRGHSYFVESNWFWDELKQRLLTDKNVLGLVTGHTGRGKTCWAIKVASAMDSTFNAQQIVFNYAQFREAIENSHDQAWIVWDEPNKGLSHRDWYLDINKAITTYLQTFRFRHKNILFALPKASLIDKSARVAFRSLWSKVNSLSTALEELLEVQAERKTGHAIVNGGEDTSVPIGYTVLHSHRALGRGGKKSIREFREALGAPGRIAHTAGRVVGPVVLNPGRALTIAGLTTGAIAGGLYVGYRLRRARINRSLDPYHYGTKPEPVDNDYAVGI